ncbi:hypothetical protein NL43_03135 [Methanosphaera sp. WGK6]|nr:hypothetical protein NL43_03135 [Methanosphaera sp. WGK6]
MIPAATEVRGLYSLMKFAKKGSDLAKLGQKYAIVAGATNVLGDTDDRIAQKSKDYTNSAGIQHYLEKMHIPGKSEWMRGQ